MSTFLLIHGAWHGAWCWSRLIPELESLGHRCVAPDLPGHGDDPTPRGRITMQDYIDCITGAIDAQSGPVILVGHSMGGMPITGAAEQRPDCIAALVYLAAFLPRDGESLFTVEERNPRPSVQPNVIFSEDQKTATVREDMLATLFYHDCRQEDVEFARARLTPEPVLPLAAPARITAANFGRLRRIYIECSDDRAICPALQQDMTRATPCEQVIVMQSGHSPFFSRPGELARILAAI
jgi:pimeloyl-ACP methyl ester carboxylesterase